MMHPLSFCSLFVCVYACSETEPDWDVDIREDVQEEVEAKCGKVKHIHVDKVDPSGHVYLRFHTTGEAQAVINVFSGRKLLLQLSCCVF